MFCQKCGEEIPNGSVFCGSCGTKQGVVTPPVVPLAGTTESNTVVLGTAPSNIPPQVQSNKEGTLKKCPSCSASTKAFTTTCSECGHEFREVKSNSNLQEFFKKIENSSPGERATVIANFPVP